MTVCTPYSLLGMICAFHAVGPALSCQPKVIPDDTRDRAEALLLLARATIEKGGASGEGGGGNLLGSPYRSGAGESPSETLEMGISHLRTGLQVRSRRGLAQVSASKKTHDDNALTICRPFGHSHLTTRPLPLLTAAAVPHDTVAHYNSRGILHYSKFPLFTSTVILRIAKPTQNNEPSYHALLL